MPRKREPAEEEEIMNAPRDEDVVNSAINAGLNEILKRHPSFNGEYIRSHIDHEKLRYGVTQIGKYISDQEAAGKRLSAEEKEKLIYKGIIDYIKSGGAFDETAKETVLRNSLEEKVRTGKSLKKKEGNIDDASEAFRDIYTMMKTGDYAARMPKLAEAVQKVYDAGFMDASLDVLRSYGLVDDRRYTTMKGLIKKKKLEGMKEATGEIERYALPQKAAAAVLAISGAAAIVLTKTGLTGSVIGSSTMGNLAGALVGISLLIAAALTLFKKKK